MHIYIYIYYHTQELFSAYIWGICTLHMLFFLTCREFPAEESVLQFCGKKIQP